MASWVGTSTSPSPPNAQSGSATPRRSDALSILQRHVKSARHGWRRVAPPWVKAERGRGRWPNEEGPPLSHRRKNDACGAWEFKCVVKLTISLNTSFISNERIAHKRDGARKDGATSFTVHDAAAAHRPPHDGLVRGMQRQHDLRSVFALDLGCAGVNVH